MNYISDVRIVDLPKIIDDRGNLSFLENGNQIPFDIQRVYFIYDVPGGAIRGGHAFQELQEIIIAMSGSFDVIVNDGVSEKKYSLNRSYYGLYIPSGIWRHMENFSTNALSLVTTNTVYDETDYIRDYGNFKKFRNGEPFDL